MQNSSSFFQGQPRFSNGFFGIYHSPFGVELKGRNLKKNNAKNYRFGYQGSEADDQVKGDGNSYSTYFRQLDPRLGRWLSIDPKAIATESPYVSMRNNPIYLNDKNGDFPGLREGRKLNREAKAILRRIAKVEKAAAKLSQQERKMAEKHYNEHGGQVQTIINSKGDMVSSVTETEKSVDSEGTITLTATCKIFNKKEWTEINQKRAQILKDAKEWQKKYNDMAEQSVRMMSMVPDVIGVSGGINHVIGGGIGVSYSAVYFTTGPDKGFHFLITTGAKVGVNQDLSANVVMGNFNGPKRDVGLDTYLGSGYVASGDFGAIGAGIEFTTKKDGSLGWYGGSIGVGPGYGGSAGKTNTFKPKFPND
jgi:RHS repeat-associated protein